MMPPVADKSGEYVDLPIKHAPDPSTMVGWNTAACLHDASRLVIPRVELRSLFLLSPSPCSCKAGKP